MTLDPILTAPGIIQLHVAFAVPALTLGPFALFRNRRDSLHKTLGRLWVVAIIGLSVSGLFIKSNIAFIGWFGPIHILSILSLWGVGEGVYYIRRRNIVKHRASMQSVWFGAMGLAGLFTLLPGRTMNRVVFGDASEIGLWVVGAGVVALLVLWRGWLRKVST